MLRDKRLDLRCICRPDLEPLWKRFEPVICSRALGSHPRLDDRFSKLGRQSGFKTDHRNVAIDVLQRDLDAVGSMGIHNDAVAS